MAYCVHCGVKLGEAETKCPLCDTEVLDPKESRNPDAEQPFPVRTPEQTLNVSRKYAISLLSLVLLVPAGVCVLIDLLTSGLTWSVYPAGVLVLIWISVIVPLLVKRHRIYITLLVSGVTLAAYLFMIEQLAGKPGWFFPIALPALALALAMTMFTVWLIRSKKVRILRWLGVILMEVGALCLFIEWLCVMQGFARSTSVSWSLFVITPCFLLAILLYVLSRNGPISSELKRRFHF